LKLLGFEEKGVYPYYTHINFGVVEDGFGGWDDDGRVDCVSFRGSYELMYSREAVINAGANRETAARVLKMQAQ
jgi:hypothetical protein